MDPKAFGAAKAKLMDLQKEMVAIALKMSNIYANLDQSSPLADVAEQLRIECGISAADVRFYTALQKKVAGKISSANSKRISLPTLRAIASASDETRDIALATLASGSVVTAADVSKIRKRLKHDRTPEAARHEADRAKAVIKAATQKAIANVRSIDLRVTDLFKELMILWLDVDKRGYATRARKCKANAAVILKDFDRIFGSEEASRDEWEGLDFVGPSLRFSKVRAALLRIAEGRFGRGHGWTLDDTFDMQSLDLFRPLRLLTGHVARSSLSAPVFRPDQRRTSVRRRLTAVELCAGAGGMLIGMHAAGFEHLAAVEFYPKAAATLRRNRPDLNVVEADIRNVDFTPYRGVDVVVGGLPCQSFSIAGSRMGSQDERDMFMHGVRAVREMNPRAFAFENVVGFTQVTHAHYRNLLIRLFGKIGYDVQFERIDAQDWGVPQRRERVIVVGIRKDESARRFVMPKHPDDYRCNLGDALAELMGANGWCGAEDWAQKLRKTRIFRNDTIDRGAVSPTLVGYSGKAPPNTAKMWAELNINIGRRPAHAPTPSEGSAVGFMPGLTEKMRARIQGFPEEWAFEGGLSHRDQQVANAFPPNAAKAVGLGLYTALEGIEFDIDAVMRQPLLEHDIVAPILKLLPAPSIVSDDVEEVMETACVVTWDDLTADRTALNRPAAASSLLNDKVG